MAKRTGTRAKKKSATPATRAPVDVKPDLRADLALSAPQPPTRARRTKGTSSDSPEVTTSSATPAPTSTETPAARLRLARCPRCLSIVRWNPDDSPEEQRAQGFTKGFTADGLPYCITCQRQTPMLSHEDRVDAATAIRQAVAVVKAEQRDLFPVGFNAMGAFRTYQDFWKETRRLEEAHDAKAIDAKKAKQALDEHNRLGPVMADEFERRYQDEVVAARKKNDRAETKADAVCIFERETGSACRICHAASPVSIIAVVASPAAIIAARQALHDREHDSHKAYAVSANSRDVATLTQQLPPDRLVFALEIGGLLGIPRAVVETWTPEQRTAVLAWIDAGCAVGAAPDCLGRPHVAAAPGDVAQCCVECGAQLLVLNEGSRAYPIATMVGQFCTAPEVEPAPPAAAPAAEQTSA